MNHSILTSDSIWNNFIINVSIKDVTDESATSDVIENYVLSTSSDNVPFKNVSTLVTWDSSADCQIVSYYFHMSIGLFISVVAAFATVGNFLVLCTFSRHSSLRTSSNVLIMNLTIADLIMSFVDFPMFAVSSFNGCWLLGYTGCQIYASTTSVFSLVTINTLAVISFDRYFAVVHRLSTVRRMAKSTIGLIIMVIWLLSIMWSILPLIGIGSYRLEGLGTSCTFNYIDRSRAQRMFFLTLVIFNFFIPLVMIIYSYSRIFIYVKRVKRELQSLQLNHRDNIVRRRVENNSETKTAIAVIVIISIFCVAWTPYVVIAFIGLFGPEGSITPLISVFPNILAKICTVSNPILYTLGHRDIRNKLKALLFAKYHNSMMRPTYASARISSKLHSEPHDLPLHL